MYFNEYNKDENTDITCKEINCVNKISIVTAYYNRKILFRKTLESISKSEYHNFEVIAVDDGSDDNERIEDLSKEFIFLKVIRISKQDKNHSNPCIPFNIGIKEVKGDIIILQNPECLHVHDILSYVSANINESNYLSMSTYSIDSDLTKKLLQSNNYIDFFNKLPKEQRHVNYVGWFNHTKYRPVYYHFCSAITRKNMDLLGGFDERYADGIGYDDDELIERINRLGLNKKICDEVSVIHMFHNNFFSKNINSPKAIEKNNLLFNNFTKKEEIININKNSKEIKPKIPKRIFFYWEGNNLSWMRYMTLYSCRIMNPTWEIVLYTIPAHSKNKGWMSREDQDYYNYTGKDYFSLLPELGIEIKKAEFSEELENKLKNISPIHRSDLYRYYQLYTGGGIYCDMDVLFFRSLDKFYQHLSQFGYDTVIHEDRILTIGFLGSSIGNQYYKELFDRGLKYGMQIESNHTEDDYQSMGVKLIYRMLNEKLPYCKGFFNRIVSLFPLLKVYNIDSSLIYKFNWEKIDFCFSNNIGIDRFDEDSIGYHWYGGGERPQIFNNALNESNYKNFRTAFSTIASEVLNMKKNDYKREIVYSFIISYKENNDDRKRNLNELLKYLSKIIDERYEVIIIEQDEDSKANKWISNFNYIKNLNYIFIKNIGVFNKGWGYNIGAKTAKGKFLIFNDTDLFLRPNDYVSSLNLLNSYDIISPYKSLYYLDNNRTSEFLNSYNFNLIEKMKCIYPTVISGGVFMIKKDSFLSVKGFDEECYGYGYEDDIFDIKANKKGLNVKFCDNDAIHIYHQEAVSSDDKIKSCNNGVDIASFSSTIINKDNYYKFLDKNKLLFEKYLKMSNNEISKKIDDIKYFGDTKKSISIVTSYFNRKKLFLETLKSIRSSRFQNFELIAVDDGSIEEERIEEFLEDFPFLKIIRIEPKNKWYLNPCIPFNIGIKSAIGDIIILQNPECLHIGDIMTYVHDNINVIFSVIKNCGMILMNN